MPATSSQELIEIVDQENISLGVTTRSVMRQQNLLHRASYVLVFNRTGELFIHQRTLNKDIYPGYWDIAAGGVVLAGETYKECALREVREELGIGDVRLRHLFDQYYEDSHNRVWGRVYCCTSEGPFILQPEEITRGHFIHPSQLCILQQKEPVTPDSVMIFSRLPY